VFFFIAIFAIAGITNSAGSQDKLGDSYTVALTLGRQWHVAEIEAILPLLTALFSSYTLPLSLMLMGDALCVLVVTGCALHGLRERLLAGQRSEVSN
jgi:hypothetical protein